MRSDFASPAMPDANLVANRNERVNGDVFQNQKSEFTNPSSPRLQNMGTRFEKLLAQERAATSPSGDGGNSIGALTAGGKESDSRIANLKQAYRCTSGCTSDSNNFGLNSDKSDSGAMGRHDGLSISAMKGCKKGVGQIGDSIDFIADLIKKGGKGYGVPSAGTQSSSGSSGGTGGTGGAGAGAGAAASS